MKKQAENTIMEAMPKDFFDMILPGVVKFLPDHYLVGDSYRCVSTTGWWRRASSGKSFKTLPAAISSKAAVMT